MARATNGDRQRYWREAIERQQASGQSIVGFCSKEKLAPATFHAWKRRLQQPRREAGRRRRRPSFPSRSSMPCRLVRASWKSTGRWRRLTASGLRSTNQSAWWSLLWRAEQREGHTDADLAHVPAGVCQDRSTDMRKSFEGLVGVVERELGQQVESGDLFLFFNRRGDRVKLLWFTGDGLVIWLQAIGRWNLRGATICTGSARRWFHFASRSRDADEAN